MGLVVGLLASLSYDFFNENKYYYKKCRKMASDAFTIFCTFVENRGIAFSYWSMSGRAI